MEVECAVFDVDDVDAELVETDENLKRADLGEPELDLHKVATETCSRRRNLRVQQREAQ